MKNVNLNYILVQKKEASLVCCKDIYNLSFLGGIHIMCCLFSQSFRPSLFCVEEGVVATSVKPKKMYDNVKSHIWRMCCRHRHHNKYM